MGRGLFQHYPAKDGLPAFSNIPTSFLLRLEEIEARGSPVFLCRLYTRLPRIGSGRDHSACPNRCQSARVACPPRP